MDSQEETVVLLVEDEAEVVNLYQNYLQSEYEVRQASNGEEALEKLDETVDVVLLDRRMPGMSGDEVATRIEERDVDPKVVMVTAVSPDTDLLHLEFDEYLVKPVSREELTDAIERMRSRSETEAKIQEVIRLASRLSTLEHKLDVEQLEESDEYRELTDELYRLREEIRSSEDDEFYHEATLSKLRGLFEGTGNK